MDVFVPDVSYPFLVLLGFVFGNGVVLVLGVGFAI